MRKAYYLLAVIFLIITIGMSGCLNQQKDRDILFQASTIDVLSKGVYDGDVNFKDLKQHGDFGIGTVNGLDGEMAALAGEFYQIKADGKAYPVDDSMETPFAMLNFDDYEAIKAAEPPR